MESNFKQTNPDPSQQNGFRKRPF